MISRTEKKMNGQRGNALIISMLTMLTMTSVGVISIRLTNTDLMVAGNLVRATQAGQASEAGILLELARHEDDANYAKRKITAQRSDGSLDFGPDGEIVAASSKFSVASKAYSTEDPDPADPGDLNVDLPIVDPANLDSGIAQLRQRMAFQASTRHIGEVQEVPGNSLDSDVCYQVFDLASTGAVPTVENETFEVTLKKSESSPVEYRARVLVGPTQCNT